MANHHAMHEDYRKIPSFNVIGNPTVTRLVNGLMSLHRYFKCRKPHPDTSRTTHIITSADGSQFKAFVITPRHINKPAPALLYYHGGAFALTYGSAHLQFCERYAVEAGCIAIFVDYRLTPRHPFPSGFEDCYAALEWVLSEADSLGIDARRVAVMGDSAGGALAAGVAQKAMDQGNPVLAQSLVYPVLDSECKTPSARNFTDVPVWNSVLNRRMWQIYLKQCPAGDAPLYAAPGLRSNVSGLPLSYVETAEFDPLRDEALAYANALKQAGIQVELNETQGTIHAYEMVASNPEVSRSMQARIDFLKQAFGTGQS